MRIDFAGIVASWQADDGEVWVEFAAGRPVEPSLFEIMTQAVVDANSALSPDDFGTGVHGTVAGGAVKLKHPPGETALRTWLGVFAESLSARGWAGVVHVAPGVRRPRWLRGLIEPRLTAFVSYDVVRPRIVEPDLCDAAARWARCCGGPSEYLLSSGLTLPDRTGRLGRHMYLALSHGAWVGAMCAGDRPGPLARVGLAADGQASFQVYDPQVSPLDLAERAREALVADCGRIRWGGVGLTSRDAHTWELLAKVLGRAPTVPLWASRGNQPVWGDYVPGVFGMQVLTDAHLSRVSDLSAWHVGPVAPGRHLVEARELGDWFGPDGPSDEVVVAAQADFGPAIIPKDLPRP